MTDGPIPASQDRLIFSTTARRDLKNIRQHTREQFGEAAVERYEALLKQAFLDVAASPQRPGSRTRPELGKDIRSYHIKLSKGRTNEVVKNPRHFILYFETRGDRIVISRVLDDRRDLTRHKMDRAGERSIQQRSQGRSRGRARERER